MNKIGCLISVSIVTFGLTMLSANAQTTLQGTQEAYIQGSDNEVNQVINQYYFKNPGKGAIKRKEPTTEINNNQNQNQESKHPGNSAWGHSRGAYQSSPKK